jgi:hypothetical protein
VRHHTGLCRVADVEPSLQRRGHERGSGAVPAIHLEVGPGDECRAVTNNPYANVLCPHERIVGDRKTDFEVLAFRIEAPPSRAFEEETRTLTGVQARGPSGGSRTVAASSARCA